MDVKQSRIAEYRTVHIKQQRCLGATRRRFALGTRNSPAVNVETWKQMGYETDRSDFYLLTYSLAVRPSENLGLLIYANHFFPIDCLLSPSFNSITLISFYTTSSHLNLGLPLLLLPSGLLSNIFLTVLLTACPIHSNIFVFNICYNIYIFM